MGSVAGSGRTAPLIEVMREMAEEIPVAAHWYVIHTYSGQEARAKQGLLERVKAHGREDAVMEVFIPEENVVEVVKGERA